MTHVLVCMKRVPDSSNEVVLTADEQAVDATHVGYTISEHEHAAIENAARMAEATAGLVTVLTVGPDDAAKQLRTALALGGKAAIHVKADPLMLGPADVAREIAAVVRERAESNDPFDVILLGNDAADTGDFQVGIRLGYELDYPVVNGAQVVTIDGQACTATVSAADGEETFEVAMPAIVTVMAGGVDIRYPSLRGRMAAKKVKIAERDMVGEAAGSGRVRLLLPPQQASAVEVLGEGPEAAGAVVDLLERLGVAR